MSIGEWNGTFLRGGAGSVAEYTAGRDQLIADGIIQIHECGGFIMWKNQTPEGETSRHRSTAGRLVYSRCALKAWSGGARVPESRKISAPPSSRIRNTAAITYGLPPGTS